MSDLQKPILIIVGPTAIGKSDFAIKIAKDINGEIINADSRLVYKNFNIGTAKPNDLELKRVKHHLINILNPDRDFNISQFLDLVKEKTDQIIKSKKTPIIVGGTGQYIKAILNDWTISKVPPNKKLREEIEKIDMDFSKKPEKTQMIAVLFTDIIGFTKISEKIEPPEVLDILSRYQKRMTEAIFKNNGTVDKFIGDAVMATFGTPISRGNDAQNALNCARDMQILMREWEKERSKDQKNIIKHRIGIHYGRCVVGNIGGDERMEFTVIGDTVNVASRICDACKENNAEIIITDNLKNQLNEEIETEIIQNFKIRGRDELINLHKIKL